MIIFQWLQPLERIDLETYLQHVYHARWVKTLEISSLLFLNQPSWNLKIYLSHVKNPHGIGWRFFFVCCLLWLVRWSRHLVIDCGLLGNRMYWSCQRFMGKGLVVVREGISTPNAPYLREAALWTWCVLKIKF
jgi:hypothetical protein